MHSTNFVELEVKVPRTIGILRDADEKSGTMLFKALGTSFVLKQSGPLSVDSKTQGKCQTLNKFSAICQLSVKILAICQLSVNPIQTLHRIFRQS